MKTIIIKDDGTLETQDGEGINTSMDLAEEMILNYDWGHLSVDWAWFAVGALSAVVTSLREEFDEGTDGWLFGKLCTDMVVESIDREMLHSREGRKSHVFAANCVLHTLIRGVDRMAEASETGSHGFFTNGLRWAFAEVLVKAGTANIDKFGELMQSASDARGGVREIQFPNYPTFTAQ